MYRFIIPATLLAAAAPCPASAKSISDQLLKLAPEARVEQSCNGRAMASVRRDHDGLKPDEVVAYAFGDVDARNEEIVASGAALRSGRAWYRLSYRCRTSDDGLTVVSFDYELGDAVPRKDWTAHYLVP